LNCIGKKKKKNAAVQLGFQSPYICIGASSAKTELSSYPLVGLSFAKNFIENENNGQSYKTISGGIRKKIIEL
jgi:hypothetical protein